MNPRLVLCGVSIAQDQVYVNGGGCGVCVSVFCGGRRMTNCINAASAGFALWPGAGGQAGRQASGIACGVAVLRYVFDGRVFRVGK